MRDATPASALSGRPADCALLPEIIRACDHAADVKDLVGAVVGLAEVGRGYPAVVGMNRVALVTEDTISDLAERLKGILELVRVEDDEPEAAPEEATVADVLDEMRKLHRATVDLVAEVTGRVKALEAVRGPEPPAT